jgi:SAM-dependent methyltransferase
MIERMRDDRDADATSWSMMKRLRKRLRFPTYPALLGPRRTTAPLSEGWGADRGTPVDRYFIERFLDEHRSDIHGAVLEMADSRYTDRFGDAVSVSDVLDIDAQNPRATVVGDLGRPDTLPAGRYDCFILTQTLQYVFDVWAAIEAVHRVLRPDGVALVTVPCVSRIAASAGIAGDFWRFTAASCGRLFRDRFDEVDVRTYGNVLTSAAFLFGLAREELSQQELDTHDEYFPSLVAVRASKRR